jgi:hypothetical protein
MLAQAFRQTSVEGLQAFLETLETQQRIEFQDIMTDDEIRIYLDTNLNSV